MYTVPLIPPDLRHEETIIQAALALDCLNSTINSVFENIDARYERNAQRVQQLTERIERAQQKIGGLVGSKKALKIFSPARFPATFRDIPVTFAECQLKMERTSARPAYEVKTRIDAGAPSTSAQTFNEKLLFFHVRSGSGAEKNSKTNLPQGMGALPAPLRSVPSVLLFDTDEFVYDVDSADKELNTWKRAKFQKQRKGGAAAGAASGQQQKQLLEPAPHSLASAAHRNLRAALAGGLRYTPRLHEAPELDLPLDLPDLPGIADDIHFEGSAQQQIAPSSLLAELPELPELVQQAENEKKLETSAAQDIPKRSHSNAGTSAPPPPPPPPPVAAATPLPPPPPMPTALPRTTTQASKKSPPPPEADTRSALMDAIRKAGGAAGGRLRAAAPVDAIDAKTSTAGAPKSSADKASTSTGGDLMADLHNKLLMRRKGISGAKENNMNTTFGGATPPPSIRTSGNPVISRLSQLIPPPAAKRPSEEDEESDNDGDDWND